MLTETVLTRLQRIPHCQPSYLLHNNPKTLPLKSNLFTSSSVKPRAETLTQAECYTLFYAKLRQINMTDFSHITCGLPQLPKATTLIICCLFSVTIINPQNAIQHCKRHPESWAPGAGFARLP